MEKEKKREREREEKNSFWNGCCLTGPRIELQSPRPGSDELRFWPLARESRRDRKKRKRMKKRDRYMRISIIKIPVRYDDVRAYTCMCTCLCMCILSSACNVCVWLRERERNACSGENHVHTRLSEKSFRTERGGGDEGIKRWQREQGRGEAILEARRRAAAESLLQCGE